MNEEQYGRIYERLDRLIDMIERTMPPEPTPADVVRAREAEVAHRGQQADHVERLKQQAAKHDTALKLEARKAAALERIASSLEQIARK